MPKMKMTCLLLTTSLLSACGGGGDGPDRGSLRSEPTSVALLSTTQIDQVTAANGLQPISGSARCDVGVFAIDYDTIGPKGERTNASGALLVPSGADPRCNENLPLLAFAKGTDVSRPDTLADPGAAYTAILTAMFAAQGYTVVVSDMLGYASSDFPYHPFLHAESAATTTIDGIRAAQAAAERLGVQLSGRVMVSGYSQGGHTAAATHRAIERDLGNELNLVGAAYLSGPMDLAASVQSPVAVFGYQVFAPFLITTMQKVYGDIYAHPEEAFLPPYSEWIEDLLPSDDIDQALAEGKLPPTNDPATARDQLIQPDFLLATQTDPGHPLVRAAERNSLLDWAPQAPTVVCYGSEDPVVPSALHSERLREAFQSQGVSNANFVDVDPFIRQAFGIDGAPPTDPAAAQTYYGNYHNPYAVPFCMSAARQMFEQLR